jgi:hypothetical protein
MATCLPKAGCLQSISSPVVITTGIQRSDKTWIRGLAFPSDQL